MMDSLVQWSSFFNFRTLSLFAQDEEPSFESALADNLLDMQGTAYIVLGVYLLILLILGIAGWAKSESSEEDYYLSGRTQGWLVSSLTIMATFFSSFALLGAPGMVYRDGVVFALFSLNVPVAAVAVYLIGARIWRLGQAYGFVTPGDMAADYYGSKYLLRLLIALCGFLYVIPYVVMQIQAGGLMAEVLFGSTEGFDEETFRYGATALALITTVYIMVGGMRSVAWTDLIQGLLLITGMLVGGLAMFLVFDGPVKFGEMVVERLPASSLTLPGNSGQYPWTHLFTICAVSALGTMVQPAQWMRFYSAKSVATLKRVSVIFCVVLTSCFMFGVMLIGLAGQVLYPLHYQIRHTVENVALSDLPTDGQLYEPLNKHFAIHRAEDGTVDLIWDWQWNWQMGFANDDRAMNSYAIDQLRGLNLNADYQTEINQLITAVQDSSNPGLVVPHPEVKDFNSILVVVLKNELPNQLGGFGALFASMIIVAIMAASMSTADSNLHALSAVATRDVYDHIIRPGAGQVEKVWIGRLIILVATIVSLYLVFQGREQINQGYDFMKMIASMGLMAVAFSTQMLPIAIDICFLRKGTGTGAAIGLAAGLFTVYLMGPLFPFSYDLMGQPEMLKPVLSITKSLDGLVIVQTAIWGLLANVGCFVLVSLFTKRPDASKIADYVCVLRGGTLNQSPEVTDTPEAISPEVEK